MSSTTSKIMKSQIPIFKDAALQEKFDRDGFVKIKLLDAEKADRLYQYFIDQQDAHDVVNGLYLSTTHTNNPDLIRKVDAHIKAEVLPEVDKIFQNYEAMMCTYITKQTGPGSDTPLHQDPTFVDEDRYISANIWIALHDINHDKGNLIFVPGTQRYIRSLRVTPSCPTAYDGVKDLLSKNIHEVPVKKGEAILINHATVHGATPNLSNGPRIAAVMAIRTTGSEWIYHYLEKGAPFDKIEKFEVDLETFIHLEKDKRPAGGRLIGNISWNFPQLSREDFIRDIKTYSGRSPLSKLFSKLSDVGESIFK